MSKILIYININILISVLLHLVFIVSTDSSNLRSTDKSEFLGSIVRDVLNANIAGNGQGITTNAPMLVPSPLPANQWKREVPLPPAAPPYDREYEQGVQRAETKNNVIHGQLERDQSVVSSILSKVDAFKQSGLVGAKLRRSSTLPGVEGAFGEEVLEAPIVFLEPPIMNPKEETELESQLDYDLATANSPAMKAAKAYELQKLGEVKGDNLDDLNKELKETRSLLSKTKAEHEKARKKFHEANREYATTGSKTKRTDSIFAGKDLEQIDNKIMVLNRRLRGLKRKRNMLVKNTKNQEQTERESTSNEQEEGEE